MFKLSQNSPGIEYKAAQGNNTWLVCWNCTIQAQEITSPTLKDRKELKKELARYPAVQYALQINSACAVYITQCVFMYIMFHQNNINKTNLKLINVFVINGKLPAHF